MKITVNTNKKCGKFNDPTCWQNSTLRYAPPADFPAFLKSRVGAAKIMRVWITLDEFYDLKTKEFFPDYDIGVARCPVEERHYPYDWKSVRPAPSGTRFRAFIKSHSDAAEQLLLNVRRFEREVSDGVMSYEEYEQVFEKAVEYCKELAPNIAYIECCNETDIEAFGNLTPEEYVPIYLCAYRAVKRLNEKHNYPLPLKIGGYAAAHPINHFKCVEGTMTLLAQSEIGDAPMDFYSYHHYEIPACAHMIDEGMIEESYLSPVGKLRYLVASHRNLIKRLGLPERPIFLNEVGTARATGVKVDSLMNASGLISFLLAYESEGLEGVLMSPWCTFHNPNLQISYTQYILAEDGNYKATPNGLAVEMLHNIAGHDRLEYSIGKCKCEDVEFCGVAVTNDEEITVIATNTSSGTEACELELLGLEDGSYTVEKYLITRAKNNAVTGRGTGSLSITESAEIVSDEGRVYLCDTLEPHNIIEYKIKLR